MSVVARCAAVLVLLYSASVHAGALSEYEFSTPADVEHFRALLKELRCLKCQNQTLADSDAPLAKDLRDEVYAMIQDGKDDGQIADFLVARYGDFVLYKPRFKSSTLILWVGPFVLLLVGGVVLMRTVGQRNRGAVAALSTEEQEKLRLALRGIDQGIDNPPSEPSGRST